MSGDNPRMRELIERSSLGTPAAQRLRESVPLEVGREIVRRAEAKRKPASKTCAHCGRVGSQLFRPSVDWFTGESIHFCVNRAACSDRYARVTRAYQKAHPGEFLPRQAELLAWAASESSPLRADSAPRSGAAHPDPESRDGGSGAGCASNP
ncbi:hypothetical protein AB0H71_13985 [Nocardia sp. NPDC050697]|uniref:hypothetical protein n=1 Tax=Nocardia sp. NPDC050697 TaxID=3155158 RepID=UPI0033E79C4D